MRRANESFRPRSDPPAAEIKKRRHMVKGASPRLNTPNNLSAYEKKRLATIDANRKVLEELGLLQTWDGVLPRLDDANKPYIRELESDGSLKPRHRHQRDALRHSPRRLDEARGAPARWRRP